MSNKEVENKISLLRKIYPDAHIKILLKSNADSEFNSLVAVIYDGNQELSNVEVPFVKSEYKSKDAYRTIADTAVSLCIDYIGLDSNVKPSSASASLRTDSENKNQEKKFTEKESEKVYKQEKPQKEIKEDKKTVIESFSDDKEENSKNSHKIEKIYKEMNEDNENSSYKENVNIQEEVKTPLPKKEEIEEKDDEDDDFYPEEPETETRSAIGKSRFSKSEETAEKINNQPGDSGADSDVTNVSSAFFNTLSRRIPSSNIVNFGENEFLCQVREPYRSAFGHIVDFQACNKESIYRMTSSNVSCLRWMAEQKAPIRSRNLTQRDIDAAKLAVEWMDLQKKKPE